MGLTVMWYGGDKRKCVGGGGAQRVCRSAERLCIRLFVGLGFLFRVHNTLAQYLSQLLFENCSLIGSGFVAQIRFMSSCLTGAVSAISLCMR